MTDLPRQLSDFEPVPGLIKADYTDFVVEEIPLYPADGVGTHTYFLVEKAGLSTFQAVHDIARMLGVRRHEIGFAGLKDSRAVARQWMSVEHIEPERLASLHIPRLRVLAVTRHRNKLRLGHLKGNTFLIKVRQTATSQLAELQDRLAELARCGVPNYFGPQRAGYHGDTWAIGRAIVRGQAGEAVDLLLGHPTQADHGPVRRARELYERGKYLQAAGAWPPIFRIERRVLKVMARRQGDRAASLAAIDKSTRTFYVSAYQSHLFNRVVATRLPSGLGQLWDGDLAWLHRSGAVFHVEQAALEQPRADDFEISPTGPLFGHRMTQPGGLAGDLEADVLQAENLPAGAFYSGLGRASGSRRPLRFRPDDPKLSLGADQHGPYLELRFTLPRGCYATALLRELFRVQTPNPTNPRSEETEASTA
jgi:tRNA pseudouridine13 synthase